TGSTAAYASAVGLVASLTTTPAAQGTLTGTATVGQTLQAPTATAYTWPRCNANARACTAIAGAAAASYMLTPDENGHTVIATAGGSLTVASPVVAAS